MSDEHPGLAQKPLHRRLILARTACEDEIRRYESQNEFGAEFVAVARAIYQENDRRSRIKARIDEILASDLTEIKIFENG